MQINVNSIRSNTKQIELFEFLKKHSPHIVLLSETNLSEKNRVKIGNYKINRNYRKKSEGGGTAICFRSDLCCEYINKPSTIKSFECCLTKLKIKCNEHVIFASVYKPPSENINGKKVQIKINAKEINEIFIEHR